jgi:hypothetical protein
MRKAAAANKTAARKSVSDPHRAASPRATRPIGAYSCNYYKMETCLFFRGTKKKKMQMAESSADSFLRISSTVSLLSFESTRLKSSVPLFLVEDLKSVLKTDRLDVVSRLQKNRVEEFLLIHFLEVAPRFPDRHGIILFPLKKKKVECFRLVSRVVLATRTPLFFPRLYSNRSLFPFHSISFLFAYYKH